MCERTIIMFTTIIPNEGSSGRWFFKRVAVSACGRDHHLFTKKPFVSYILCTSIRPPVSGNSASGEWRQPNQNWILAKRYILLRVT